MPVRTIIYEDNARLRESLEQLLSDGTPYTVVGAFEHCDEAEQHLTDLYPDLVIMDINMPGIGGVEGVRIIRSRMPDVRIIMHTVFYDDQRIFDTICAGADGYLLKNTPPEKLVRALDDIMDGGSPMSPMIAQKVFRFFRQSAPVVSAANTAVNSSGFRLTTRELDILDLLVRGNSYKMIASLRNISLDTVRKHIKNIYHKLHVQCGTEAVAKAITLKIVKLD